MKIETVHIETRPSCPVCGHSWPKDSGPNKERTRLFWVCRIDGHNWETGFAPYAEKVSWEIPS